MILRPEDPQQLFFMSRAELVAEEPLVQTVGQVVDRLDVTTLYGRYSEAGRAFYDPAMLVKVWFFAYCDGVRSSREVAKRIKYDLRYQYFTGSLRPDFRTLNRFRLEHLDLLGGYFAQIVLHCEQVGLVDVSVLAIDSTKIRASSSARRTVSTKRLDQLGQQFRTELHRDATAEEDGSSEEESIPAGREGMAAEAPITDPDARFMKTAEGSLRPCYNAHIAVDKNQVIVAAEVSTCADDSVSFPAMVEQSGAQVRGSPAVVLADGGYYSGGNVKHAVGRGYDLYMPVPQQRRVPDERFEREAFVYDELTDSYRCPAGETLSYQSSRTRHGITRRVYAGSRTICGGCPLRSGCTQGPYRRLEMSEVYPAERQLRTKMVSPSGQARYAQRNGLVEPVFGNLKFNLGFTRFCVRTLAKVRGEFWLMCIAHNLKKLAAYGRSLRPVHTAALTAVYLALFWLVRLSQRLQGAWGVNWGHYHAHGQPTG